MALAGNIVVRMSGDANPFVRELDRGIRALDNFAQSAVRTQRAADSFTMKGPKIEAADTSNMGEMSSQAQEQAGEIQAAFATALAPLNRFAATMTAQIDRIGGTIVTLARRIDSEMKLPKAEAAISRLQQKLRDEIAKGAGAAEGSLNRVQAAVQRIGPTADKALGAFQGFLRLKNLIGDFGDVAGTRLSSMFNFRLGPQIAQVTGLRAAFRGVNSVVHTLKNSVIALGAEIAVALGAFALAFKGVQFLKASTVEASNLNESVSKMGVIFGNQAQIVQNASDGMATRFGTVKTEFIDTAAIFGQLLQGMGGQTQKASAETSVQLAKLAADAGSIFNVGFDEAAGKIASALRGQSEPISAFGIDVQDAATKQEAFRLGLIKAGQEMSTQQKVAARTSLIIKGLAVAQGDLANTIDSPANAMRRFGGTMTNAGANLMSVFLPALQKGMGLLNEFATWLDTAFTRNRGAISSFAARIGDAIGVAASYLRNLPAVWSIVQLKFQEGIANVVAVFQSIPQNLAIIGEWIKNNWVKLIFAGIGQAIKAFWNLSVMVIKVIGTIVSYIPSLAIGLVKVAFSLGWSFAKTMGQGIYSGLKNALSGGSLDLPALMAPNFASLEKEIQAKFAMINKSNPMMRMDAGGPAAAGPMGGMKGPSALDPAAMESQKRIAEGAKKIIEETRTPLEKFQTQVRDLNEMFKSGAVDQETYKRAFKKALEEYGQKAKQVYDDTRTPLEKYNVKLHDLGQLFKAGLINKDTFDRAKKSGDEFSDKAKSIFEESRTPLEKYGEKLKELDALKSAGLIDEKTYERSKKLAGKEELGQGGETKFAGALELGSKEAYSALLQFRAGGTKDDSIKSVAKNSKDTVGVLNRIEKKLGASGQSLPLQRREF
ncbi:hypothetical protein SAMN05444166_6277 [Singulisphaera sp. GP187]|uniref:hypothetical protein n=1 Tax=Singulisphaera sp. GP187 TaxID=1882752 RepID=UPI000925D7E9|nr:hypothetical protein [Singulisphaera sp. GP187]SIO60128.1 hypothetical protein SAMN05444166_6277 [Singulisphaera sp. GP187]